MKEKLKQIIDETFTRQAVREKMYAQPESIIEAIPQIYARFEKNPKEFQEFYQTKFKKRTQTIGALTEQQLYGVLVVKGREYQRAQELDEILDDISKNLAKSRTIKDAPKLRDEGRSPGMGLWYTD